MITYIIIGVVMFVAGLVLVTFVPFSKLVERIGSLLMGGGVVIAVIFPLVRDLWVNSRTLQIITYSVVLVLIIALIMFSGKEEKKK